MKLKKTRKLSVHEIMAFYASVKFITRGSFKKYNITDEKGDRVTKKPESEQKTEQTKERG